MPEAQARGRRWIGRAIIGISIVHTFFAFLAFGPVLVDLLQSGLFNSVGEDAMRGAVTWFVFAGLFMFTTGLFVDQLEKNNLQAGFLIPGWVVLVITALGIIMMPVSGFWLMLPPAIAMIVTGKQRQVAA